MIEYTETACCADGQRWGAEIQFHFRVDRAAGKFKVRRDAPQVGSFFQTQCDIFCVMFTAIVVGYNK
jgi:hypothetical protein